MTIAHLISQAQRSSIEQLLRQKEDLLWLVYILIFDEGQFNIKLRNEPCGAQSILGQHAVLHWDDADLNVRTEEVLLSPVALDAKTADCTFEGLRARSPLPFDKIAQAATLPCVQLCADSVVGNFKIFKHLSRVLGPQVPLLFTRCLQHRAALCMSALTKPLNVISPMFCTVRVVNSGFHHRRLRAAVRAVIAECFVWERREAPNQEDLAMTARLLDECFLSNLAREGGEEHGADQRKAEAECLKRMFTGDIRNRCRICHHCRGCCTSLENAIDNMVDAIMKPLERRFQTPSANRWLQLSPVLAKFVWLRAFH